jgi:8-oxo-dGTP pyrophosphatase MutT (NUDIX family)
MQTIHKDVASAIILSKDGKILLGRKQPGKPSVYPDCWHIPGGLVEADETPEAALAREIREETGVDVSSCEVSLADDSGRGEAVRYDREEPYLAKMHFYVFFVKTGRAAAEMTISEDDDLINLTWFDLQELSNIKLTPPSVILFGRLGYLKP